MDDIVVDRLPGVVFDPREPTPPGFERPGIQAMRVQPGYNRVEPVLPQQYPDVPFGQRGNIPRAVAAEQDRSKAILPPYSTTVAVQAVHDTAKFTITHLFWNEGNGIKQGSYQFPLPLDATVTDFSCRIGTDRIIRGKIKPNEEARQDFDAAVQQDRIAGLVEKKTSELFNTSLGNIPSRTKMKSELSFICHLKHKVSSTGDIARDIFTLTLPTCLAPRYGQMPPCVELRPPGRQLLRFEANILTAEEMISVKSPTHRIVVERRGGHLPVQRWEDFAQRQQDPAADLKTAFIKLEEGMTNLDKDIVVNIETAIPGNSKTPHASLERHPTFENSAAVQLTLPASFMLRAERYEHDGEIVFVADRSGSMEDKIDGLRSALMFFIGGLPENRPFNIWCFGSHFTQLWPRSRPFNEQTKTEAVQYVRGFQADMSGTEILRVLKKIAASRGGYHSMDVIVLTDGQVWRPEKTIDFVKQIRRTSESMVRYFCLGIGESVSHQLVEGIAKAGGGYAEVITSASHGGWEDRVVAVLDAAKTGHVSPFGLELEWADNSPQGQSICYTSPAKLSSISPFIRSRIFMMFDLEAGNEGPAYVVLKAHGNGDSIITERVPIARLRNPDSVIHKFAARALLGDLERGESPLHMQRDMGMAPEKFAQLVRNEAVRIGCKWSLVSKWTSFCAVEEETPPEEIEEQPEPGVEDAKEDYHLSDVLLGPRDVMNVAATMLLPEPEADGNSDIRDSASDTESTASGPAGGFYNRRDGNDDDDDDGNAGGGPAPPGGHGIGGYNPGIDANDVGGQGGPFGRGPQNEQGSQNGNEHGHSRSGFVVSTWESTASRAAAMPSNPLARPRFTRRMDDSRARPRSSSPTSSTPRLIKKDRHGRGSKAGITKERDSLTTSKPPRARTLPLLAPQLPGSSRAVTEVPVQTPSGAVELPTSGWSTIGMNFQCQVYEASPGSSRAVTEVPVQTPSWAVELPTSGWSTVGMPSQFQGYETSPGPIYERNEDLFSSEMLGQPNESSTWPFNEPIDLEQAHARSISRYGSHEAARRGREELYTGAPTPNEIRRWRQIPPPSSPPIAVADITPPHDAVSRMNPREPHVSASVLTRTATSAPAMIAPTYNPPTSTSLIVNEVPPGQNTEEDEKAIKVVHLLLPFQKPNGCFALGSDALVRSTLGPSFAQVVASLMASLPVFDTVVTVAVVALLEEQFQQFRSLWLLMVQKGVEYIEGQNLGANGTALMQAAKTQFKNLPSVVEEIKRHEGKLQGIELEVAPVM